MADERDVERVIDLLHRRIGPHSYATVKIAFRNGRLCTTSVEETEVWDDNAPVTPVKGGTRNGRTESHV